MNEAPLSDEPLTDDVDAPRRGLRLGCLARIVIAIAAIVGLVILIGETFDQGPPPGPASRDLNAGPAEEYARADVSFFPPHFWIVRLEDGEFRVFYNRSSKQQELGGDCRVAFDEQAQLTGLAQLPGFDGAFVEECNNLRATWRADGAFAGGAGYGDLDRFDTEVDGDGRLIVKTDERTCTRSRGVPGVPPFDVTTCD